MGCCESQNTNQGMMMDKVKSAIEAGSIINLKMIVKMIKHKDPNFSINSIRIQVDENMQVPPLGFALLMGQVEAFNFILNDLKGDFELMESIFNDLDTSGLSIICLNNYLLLLEVYLPLFIKNKKNSNEKKNFHAKATLNFSVGEHLDEGHDDLCPYTPIQLACENGHISIINFLKTYCEKLSLVPSEIDIHYVEPVTGCNCALIACKNNNFAMIKFLHSQCNANFHIINNCNENALNVLAFGSSNNRAENFKCIQYLVEKIGVDATFNYQETLLMLDQEKTVVYFEETLQKLGISVKKSEIEKEAHITVAKRTMCRDYDTGIRFTFTRMFPDLSRNPSIFGSRALS